MAAIRLEKFRQITNLTVDVMPDDVAIAAIKSATAIINRITGRHLGHAIEQVYQSGLNLRMLVHSHGLPSSGTVLVAGTNMTTLDGEKAYTRVDGDEIEFTGVTVQPQFIPGMLASMFVTRARVMDSVAIAQPSPIAMVKEVRMRAAAENGQGPFPATAALDENDWYCDTRQPNLTGEVEIYRQVNVYKRVRGMINPVVQKVLREIELTYYAGFVDGVPDDLLGAIAAFAMVIGQDPSGQFQSENFEDYSYQRMDPAMLRSFPTAALSVVLGYRVII